MKRVGAALNQLGNYPEDNKGRTSVVQYFQAKNQNIEQEKYKTALIELILAHRLCMFVFFYCLFYLTFLSQVYIISLLL